MGFSFGRLFRRRRTMSFRDVSLCKMLYNHGIQKIPVEKNTRMVLKHSAIRKSILILQIFSYCIEIAQFSLNFQHFGELSHLKRRQITSIVARSISSCAFGSGSTNFHLMRPPAHDQRQRTSSSGVIGYGPVRNSTLSKLQSITGERDVFMDDSVSVCAIVRSCMRLIRIDVARF